MISVAEIIKVLTNLPSTSTVGVDRLVMSYFSHLPLVGIGIDESDKVVLVLPAQEDVSGFETEYAVFDPSSKVFIEETSQPLPHVSTLRCALDRSNLEKVKALAVIIKGVADLQENFGKCGKAIHEMKDFFTNNFEVHVNPQTVTGLFGELLVIAKSKDREKFVGLWHTNSDASFDFSSGNVRIEVKTTRSLNRIHQFTSNQISESLDSEVFIASVSLQVVEKGMTISELVRDLQADLKPSMKSKLVDCVIETLGVPPELLDDTQIDFVASKESIWLISSSRIPSPQAREGVLSMEWKASIGPDLPEQITLDEVFAG